MRLLGRWGRGLRVWEGVIVHPWSFPEVGLVSFGIARRWGFQIGGNRSS